MSNYTKLRLITGNLLVIVLITAFAAFSLHLSQAKPIWRDEAFSQLLSQQSLKDIISSTASDYNPPLFYILLHYWQRLTGLSEPTQRVLPLLFSVLTIWTIYATAPALFGKKASKLLQVLLVLCLVTNGSLLYYSYELRPYSLMMWLVFHVFYFSVMYVRNPTRRYALLTVFTSIALLYTQTLGILWVGLVGLGVGISLVLEKKWSVLRNFVLLFAVSLLCYLPWLYVVVSQVQKFASSFWLKFKPEEKLQNLSALFAYNEGPLHLPEEVYTAVYTSLYRLSIAAFLVSFIKGKLSRLLSVLISACLVILWYVSYRTPLFYGRYFVFLSPLMSCLLAYSVYALLTRTRSVMTLRVLSLALAVWMLGVYTYGTATLWKDYMLGVARVNYFEVKAERADNFYVTSDLDIMPCMTYQPNCYYVGERENIKNYTGVLHLKRQAILNSWNQVEGNTVGVVYREDKYQDMVGVLKNSYTLLKDVWLGEDAHMAVFAKKS